MVIRFKKLLFIPAVKNRYKMQTKRLMSNIDFSSKKNNKGEIGGVPSLTKAKSGPCNRSAVGWALCWKPPGSSSDCRPTLAYDRQADR